MLAGMEVTAEANGAVEVAAKVEVVVTEAEAAVMARAPMAVAAMAQAPTALETAVVVVNGKTGNLGNGTSYNGRVPWIHCTTPCIQRPSRRLQQRVPSCKADLTTRRTRLSAQ